MQTASSSETFGGGDFKAAFQQRVGTLAFRRLVQRQVPKEGRPPKLKLGELLMGLVFHCLQGSGTLAQNIRILCRKQLAESSLSERRQNLPWEVFTALLGAALGPKAGPEKHPLAFYQKWRLVAVDGTQFSVSNTPQILSSLSKAASRRMKGRSRR